MTENQSGEITIRPVATVRSPFTSKFGIPRQSGIVDEVEGQIVFTPEFRREEAIREIEGFDYLWLIWGFSGNTGKWGMTVRPPRLGGNKAVGVFASRSPFRPNGLGLSSVKLTGICTEGPDAPYLTVCGADLMDGTPIFDIKPYIPYADCKPEAESGFAPDPGAQLSVEFLPEAEKYIPPEKRDALRGVLANDPRPRYKQDGERVYALEFAGLEVKFQVKDNILRVLSAVKAAK